MIVTCRLVVGTLVCNDEAPSEQALDCCNLDLAVGDGDLLTGLEDGSTEVPGRLDDEHRQPGHSKRCFLLEEFLEQRSVVDPAPPANHWRRRVKGSQPNRRH